MATEVGVGYVSIVPSAKGFGRDLAKQIGPDMPAVGREAGDDIGEGIKDGVKSKTRNLHTIIGDLGGSFKTAGSRLWTGFSAVSSAAISALKIGAIGLASAVGAAGFAAVKFVSAASEQEQALGGLRAVFKGNADAAQASAEAGTRLNLSTTDYAKAATLLGAQLKNLGADQATLLPQTEDLLGLAADMAAQFGGSTMEAVEALTSAFRGETDPIERYGISLSESAIAAHAVSGGFVQAKVDTVKLGTAQANLASAQANLREKQADGTTTAEELQAATAKVAAAEKAVSDALDGKMPKMDAATKMAVVQDLIMKQSTDTLGAHNRELDTAQSKQENLRSIWANASATLGESLLPIASTFYDVLGKLIPRLVEVLLPAIGWLSERMQGWADWVIERMPMVEEAIGRFAQRVIDMWPAVVGWFSDTADTVRAKWPAIVQALYDVREFAGQVAERIGELWARWRELPPQVQAFVASAVALKLLGLDGIFRAATGAVAGMIGPMLGLNAAMLANPATWVAAAIALLVAALVGVGIALRHFYSENETFRRNWDAAWEDVRVAVEDFLVVWNEDLWPAIKHVLPVIAGYASYYLGSVARFVKLVTWWIDKLVSALKTLRDAWDWIKGSAGQWTGGRLPGNSTGAGGGGAGSFATGGPIPGTGARDNVPFHATPGEYVLNKRMVAQAGGVRQLEAWRAGLAGPSGVEVGTIIINNPVAEPASQSLPKAVRKLAYVGVGT